MIALNEKMMQLYQAGRYQEALPLAQEDLEITEKATGPESLVTGLSLNNLAGLYKVMGAYKKALPLQERAVKIWENFFGPEHPDTAAGLSKLALLYQASGSYEKALPLQEQAVKIWGNFFGPEHPDTAAGLDNLATLYMFMGRYNKALSLYQRALSIREKALGPEHPDTATSLHNLAVLYRFTGAYTQALSQYQRALKITEKSFGPEHFATATVLGNLATLYGSMGSFDQALPLARRALKISEKALFPEHPDTAFSLETLVALYLDMGSYDQAMPLCQRSLQIRKKALGAEHPYTASSFSQLAELYQEMGSYDQALPLWQRALQIYEKSLGPEHPDTASCLGSLADLYRVMGAYDQALPQYRQTLQIKEKSFGPEHPFTANSLAGLALLYQAMGAYDQALPLHQRALQIYEKSLGPEAPHTATCLQNVAGLFQGMGTYDQALPLYQRALQIYEKSLGPEHPHTSASFAQVGYIYLFRRDWVQAEHYFKQGNHKPGLVELHLALGCPEEALQLMSGIVPDWRSKPTDEVRFYTQKGLALAGIERLQEAAGALWQAVQGTETLRQKVTGERAGFLQAGSYGGNIRPYRELVMVLAQMDSKGLELPPELKTYGPEPRAAAFYFAEATKARALLENLAQAARKTSKVEIPQDLGQREQILHSQLAATENQWEKALQGGKEAVQEAKDKRERLNAELQALIQELRESCPRYAALYYPQPVPARNLPLQENEVLLEYELGEKASYVFIVRKGGVHELYPINMAQEVLENKVRTLMEPLLNRRMFSFSLNQGKELYDLLLAPALATVKEGERVIIVPDGILGLLPFEALVMEAGISFEKSVFVGDRPIPLVYYQSATVLALQRQLEEQQTRRPLFALGHPIYSAKDPRYLAYKQGKPAPPLLDQAQTGYGLQALATTRGWGKTTRSDKEGKELNYDPLPHTAEEVKEIAQLWGVKPEPPDVLLGVEANETQLRQAALQDYRYLHFATHADLPGQVQGIKEPFILLGQVENNKKDDGFLTISEVLELKLRAQMVVLSACLTGRGQVMEGEGVANFARAFQYAGARSVVVSLWDVSKVAVEFMKIFYSHLKSGKDRATALRLTRQQIKEKYPDPLLWAVFILHGEG